LRREYFGGLAFNTGNGDIIELDKEAFALLAVLDQGNVTQNELKTLLVSNKMIRQNNSRFEEVLKELLQNEIVCHGNVTKSDISPKSINHLSSNLLLQDKTPRQWLSAPETVHWAVTCRCSKDCPECYAKRFRHTGTELSTNGAFELIDKLAKWGVFQLAVGGGEPFEKEELPDIVSRATASGLVVHATTGIKDFRYKDISPYAGNIRNIQIGLSTHDLSSVSLNELYRPLSNSIRVLKDAGMSPGVNIILSKPIIRNFDTILESIVSSGVERIVFIRFKPPDSRKLWQREKPDQDQLLFLQRKIISIRKKYPEMDLRIDCALSFLQRNIPESLSKRRIKGMCGRGQDPGPFPGWRYVSLFPACI